MPSEKGVQYEIYEPYNLTKLNLSICNEEKINLYIPLILSEETKYIYENMKSLGYDMFNINDPFYQDLCTPYKTENNTDIPLSARKEYIYNNKDSKCQANCDLSSYIPNSLYINCTCNIEINKEKEEKKEKKFSGKTLYESFYDVLKYANFNILKCYNLIFGANIFNNNIGNFITLFAFSIYFICLILFIAKGNAPLINKINDLISTHIEEIDNKNNIIISKRIFQSNNDHKKIKANKMISNPKKKKNKKNRNKKNRKSDNLNNLSIYQKNSIDNLTEKKMNKINDLNSQKGEKLDKFELNELEYEEAIYYDKRSFIRIYWDILCREHLIIFTFFICNDYNILYIKYVRFIFLLATDMTMNVFFYSDESMHKIFLNYGKYNFIQQIPQIIYTTIISQLLEVFLCYLSLTDKYFYQIKNRVYNFDKKQL